MKKFEKGIGKSVRKEGKLLTFLRTAYWKKISKGNINIWHWFMIFYHKCDTSLV